MSRKWILPIVATVLVVPMGIIASTQFYQNLDTGDSHLKISKFKDGSVTCYVAQQNYAGGSSTNPSMSCLQVK